MKTLKVWLSRLKNLVYGAKNEENNLEEFYYYKQCDMNYDYCLAYNCINCPYREESIDD